MKRNLWLTLSAAAIPIAVHAAPPVGSTDPAALEFFEKKVRPVLVDNCYNCHSANTNAKGGLRVDDRGGLLAGGDSGPAVVPGHPESSLLLKAVAYHDADLKMPPKKELAAEQVANLTTWIRDGAAWPPVEIAAIETKSNPKYDRLRKEHWAWQSLTNPKPPAVHDTAWAQSDIDQFVLAKLEDKHLKPVADADKTSLIRRVSFDLTGLPPTPEEITAFLKDESAGAFETLVDRLLASPAFGERWGRHWLDVARYGESTGSSRNVPYPHAWRYRDYVIDAFNADKPYNRFITEQIAGDLLPADSDKERADHQIATGFLALGVKDVNQRFKVRFVMDNIDEQIDTVSRSVIGLTASCARCHDHKFDPIPQADYYHLAGIFQSTDLCAGVRNKMGGGGLDYYDTEALLPLTAAKATTQPAEKVAQLKKEVDAAKAEFFAIRGTPAGTKRGPDGFPVQRPLRLKYEKLLTEYQALTDPAVIGPVALGVRESKTIADTEIRVRGEAEKLGPVVPRGFLSIVEVPGTPAAIPADHSGRLELAQWLTNEKNPLTSRVLANRVWEHLFGQGIVRSVDNFGVTGDVPSHPELLDHLAGQFVHDGWSVKKLIKSIVLSRTYRLSSENLAENFNTDPGDRLLWRHAPRRLDAEEIRDATLAVAGTLDSSRLQASPAKDLKVIELPNNGPAARRLGEVARASSHRSIYLPLLRGLVPTSLEVFDFAEQGMVTGSRDATTVATQALYLLNDPFVRQQSMTLAEHLLSTEGLDESARIDRAYRLTVGRAATPTEVARAKQYLADYEQAAKDALTAPPVAAENPPVAIAEADDNGGTPAAGDAGNKKKAKPAVPVNPDEVVQVEAPVKEVVIHAKDAKTAAWASFSQALLGSAEFRYLK